MRLDSRSALESRPISIQPQEFSEFDGAAFFSLGNSKVLCTVKGPTDVKSRSEIFDKATVEVRFKFEFSKNQCIEKHFGSIIEQVIQKVALLDSFPRSLISIDIQIIENHGSILSCAINALICALLEAGIPCRGMAAAVELGWNIDGFVVDPSENEESCDLFVFLDNKAILREMKGHQIKETFMERENIAQRVSSEIIEDMKKCFVDRVQSRSQLQ